MLRVRILEGATPLSCAFSLVLKTNPTPLVAEVRNTPTTDKLRASHFGGSLSPVVGLAARCSLLAGRTVTCSGQVLGVQIHGVIYAVVLDAWYDVVEGVGRWPLCSGSR